MEEVSRKVQKASIYSKVTLRAHKGAMHRMSAKASTPSGHVSESKLPIGAMEEASGKV